MSYYVSLKFKKVENELEVLNIINDFPKLFKLENVEEYIEKEKIRLYAFYMQQARLCDYDTNKLEFKMGNNFMHKVINDFFSTIFIYYPSFKVLGMIGYTKIKEIDDKFTKSFEFQNSSDQDYNWEYWNELVDIIPSLKQAIEKYKVMTIEELRDDTDDDFKLEYYRKSALYKYIEELLQIDDVVYQNNDKLITFRVMPNSEKIYRIGWKLNDVFKKMYKTLGDF